MATSLSATIVFNGAGSFTMTGGINAVAKLRKGGAEYAVTGDIVGTAVLDNTPAIKITGTASGLLSGAVNAKITLLGNNTYKLSGTAGSQTLSGGGQIKDNGSATLLGSAA